MKQLLVELQKDSPVSEQTKDIQEEWSSGKYKKILLHIYSGLPDEQCNRRVAQDLQSCFPEGLIVGIMSAGEIKDGKLMPQGILISAILFESTDVHVKRYDHVKGYEHSVGETILHDLEADPEISGVELLFPGTDMHVRPFFEALSQSKRDLPLWGAYSGSHTLNAPVHFVFDTNDILYDSVLVTTFSGKDFHIDIDKTIGWEPLGLPFHVTKAKDNHLIELDGHPASEIYEKFLQIDRNLHNNAEEGYAFPLLAKYKGEEWLRSAFHIEPDGSLNLHGFVTEGTEIQLSYGNPANIVRKVNKRLEVIRQFKPQVVLLYSCVVRKAFWGNLVNMEMEPFSALCSTAGFHTGGEVCRNANTGEVVEHNVTLLSIAMREGEAPEAEFPKVQVDDTMLKGQADLLRRLTNLIYTTMGELQKAHNDLRKLNEKLTVMAERDPLTNLYNRGKITGLIRNALDDARIESSPVSIIMVDVDHFKKVNDVYGHHVGDIVLKEVARMLKCVAETSDGYAGRWGGEEFFLLLPDTDERAAMMAAEHLRISVSRHHFPDTKKITISLGVITVQGANDKKEVFFKVDKALYQAKEEGRNRTVQAKY
ncbi:MAG: GGDEF domain-containing protein [Lachnospiraceae bacterium]|nr:GGDEF domain-containing protein [Lachnospiraceae bacterium]